MKKRTRIQPKAEQDEPMCAICGLPEWNSAHKPDGIFAQIESGDFHPFQKADVAEVEL